MSYVHFCTVTSLVCIGLTYKYLQRNASDTFEGVFNMGNGVDGNFDILRWNYQNTTPSFDGACAKVHGSGGELYSRRLTKNTIGLFVADFCRFIPFDYEDEVHINGILGYKFTAKRTFLDNGLYFKSFVFHIPHILNNTSTFC